MLRRPLQLLAGGRRPGLRPAGPPLLRSRRLATQQQRSNRPQQPALPLASAVSRLEGKSQGAEAGSLSGEAAGVLGRLRAGDRTAYLRRVAELGHANAGVSLEYLRLVFTDGEREWAAGDADGWAASSVGLLSAAGLEMRVQPLLWVLSQCSKAGADAGRACVVLALAEQAGVPRDVHMYSALVNVAAKQRRGANFPLAAQLVETMRAEGVPPNEITHNSLIDALGRAHRETGADRGRGSGRGGGAGWGTGSGAELPGHELLQDMVELDGIAPSARTLTGLAYAIGRRNQPSSGGRVGGGGEGGAAVQPAFAALDFLRQHSIVPDVVFYTTLMHVCAVAKGGADLDSAHSILYMLEQEGLEPDRHTYDELLLACALADDGGQPQQAETIFERLLSDGLKPSLETYNKLMESYARRPQGQGDREAPIGVLRRIWQAGLRPSERTYELLMTATLRAAPPAPPPAPRQAEGGSGLRGMVRRLLGRGDGAGEAAAVGTSAEWRPVSCHDIAAIWVAFFSRYQRYRCG